MNMFGVRSVDPTAFWTIKGVEHNGEVLSVDITKGLLLGGQRKTQKAWVAFSRLEAEKGGFVVPSLPLLFSVCRTLWRNRDVPAHKALVKEIRQSLDKTFNELFTLTLSLVRFMRSGEDEAVHEWGMPGEYTVRGFITGPCQFITEDVRNASACKALLGSDNLQEINDVFHWITGKDTHLWRSVLMPEKPFERPMALGVSVYGGFALSACSTKDYHGFARGVRVGT